MKTRSSSTALSRRYLIGAGAAAALVAASSLGASAGPRRGGVLRVAVGADPSAAGVGRRLIAPGSVFDCLTEIGADGQLRGELATDWHTKDAKSWVLGLTNDAVFHDGRGFEAKDAIASLANVTDVPSGIVGLKRLGRHKIEVTLDAPDPEFPFFLSEPSMIMRPADDAEGSVGTGLYRFVDASDPDSVRLARVVDHRRDGRAGWFDRIELLRIATPKRRVEALLAGRVDVAGIIDPTDPRLSRARMNVRGPKSRSHLQLEARGPNARAISDALKIGLDRADLLQSVLGGYGQLAGDHPLSAAAIPEPDIDAARSILRAAGVCRIGVAAGTGLSDFHAVPALLSALGDFAGQTGIALAVATASPDLSIGVGRAMPTANLALRSFPKSGISDPEGFAHKLAQARRSLDTEQRNEIYTNLAQIIATEGLVSVPVFAHSAFAFTDRLTHPRHIGALDTLDSARMGERWFYGSLG